MTSLRRALWLLAFLGIVGGAVPLALAFESDHLDNRALTVVFGPLIGWAFIGTGLFAWWRRPENRFGPLMTAVGFTWCIGGLWVADVPGLFIAGLLLGTLPYGLLVHMLLAFPRGALEGRFAIAIVAAGYFVTTVMQLGWVLTVDTTHEECGGCPANPILLWDDQTVSEAISSSQSVIGILVIAALIVALYTRWRVGSPVQRRGLAPVILTGALVSVALVLTLAADLMGVSGTPEEALDWAGLTLLASVPFAFLIGLMRTRMSRAGAVGELVTRLADAPRRGELRDALAQALGDDSLMLAYWLPNTASYVDARGHPVQLPDAGQGRGLSHVETDGRRVATIVYDASMVEDDPELVDTIGRATALALENERLDAELCAHVEELRSSRMRLIEVGMAERRGLERNLHDGAQQRLVSLALTLRTARARLEGNPEAGELLDGAGHELDLAISELRELARGIHPAVLSDRGLPAALESLAARSPVPVEVGVLPVDRLPEPVELAAYYVISEALTNVVKYADATHARVDVARTNGHVLVEVADDGVGGADPERGTGLRGLKDRVLALEGRLAVESEAGRGTRVRAQIPCA